jgi:hypothetical protein
MSSGYELKNYVLNYLLIAPVTYDTTFWNSLYLHFSGTNVVLFTSFLIINMKRPFSSCSLATETTK